MVEYLLRFSEEQKDKLESLSGNISEHIRRAIDEYLERRKEFQVSVSLSKKKGEING